MREKEHRGLWTLFTSMLYISAFTFGGGFVIVTLMKRRFVDELGWLNDQEMLDMTALAQSAPGAIAINAAILVGRRVRGFGGMLAAVLGTAIPPLVTLYIISHFYTAFAENPYVATVLKGMQAGVVAVIADVVCIQGRSFFSERNVFALLIMLAAFAASFVWNVNAAYILLAAVGIGVVKATVLSRRRKR